jgi:hypothetical protein
MNSGLLKNDGENLFTYACLISDIIFMDHPFFNTIVYPWSREDARELHKVFTHAYRQFPERIRLIYEQSVTDPPPLTLPAAADLVWREVLNNLAGLGGLQSLCTLMKAKFPTEIILNAIAAVESAKPASEIKIISNELFILDCDLHREAISKCTSDINAKALLIRGQPKSGKSHCRHIFKSIADEKGAEVLYLYDGVITTVDEAIESIFSTLGAGKENIPPKVTTDDAWYRAICIKLKGLATDKKLMKVWVVVDDLGYINGKPESGPIMDTKIRLFFEQFVLFMQDPSFAKYFRLLLINYSETEIPTKWKTHMWAETNTDEKDVQQSHIEDFLKEWAAFNKMNMIGPELKAMAVEVITLADTPPAEIARLPRLERIHTILNVKLDEILRRAAS